MSKSDSDTTIIENATPEIIAAFNAGYMAGKLDGIRYGNSTGDAPDRATRRREWLDRR